MHRSAVARLLTLVFAALQLGAPPLASVADAWVERDGAPRATAHIESHGSPGCPRVHPVDCGLCQVLSALAAPPRRPATVPAPPSAVAVRAETRLGVRPGGRVVLTRPRAPPAS